MRKAVALTVAAAMALSLAACGAPASESTAESTAPRRDRRGGRGRSPRRGSSGG